MCVFAWSYYEWTASFALSSFVKLFVEPNLFPPPVQVHHVQLILYSANIYVSCTYSGFTYTQRTIFHCVSKATCDMWVCLMMWRPKSISESLFHTFNTCPVSPIVRHSYGISLGGSDAVRGHHCFGIHEAAVAVLHEEIFGSDGDF